MNEVPSLVEIERAIGLTGSFHDFVEIAWPLVEPTDQFIDNWHIDLICKDLEDITHERWHNEAINVPPGSMKSLLVSVFWPAWTWIRFPGKRFIYASFDASLTARDAKKMLLIIQSEWYKERWGDRFSMPPKVGVTDFTNSAGGFRFSTSVHGKVTGRHADIFVVDDPVKPLEVTGEALETCIKWWKETVSTRFRNLARSCRVIIMQRLAENDLVGHIQREEKDQQWRFRVLPAEYEPEAGDPGDPRKVKGELLCPRRVTRLALEKLKKVLGGIGAAAQLQQRPVPAGGAVFKKEWLERYWTHTSLPKRFDQIICSWDCAFKGTDDSDFVVGQVWGRKGSDFYLLDQVRGQKTFSETCVSFVALTNKWPKAVGKLVEDKANGTAVIDTLMKKIPGIIAIGPEGGKESRANACQPLFEAENIVLPDPTMPGFEWVDLEYKPELMVFPRGLHDDQVDATTQALNYLFKKRSYLTDAMAKLKQAGIVP